jgi:hypothetical protein
MKFAATYALAVGILIIGQWTYFLLSGQVPELASEPLRIAFHLAAELATALALIVAGAGLLREARGAASGDARDPVWARSLAVLALGMLIYTLIQSPGYFAQQESWAPVAMFGVLLILALVSLARIVI